MLNDLKVRAIWNKRIEKVNGKSVGEIFKNELDAQGLSYYKAHKKATIYAKLCRSSVSDSTIKRCARGQNASATLKDLLFYGLGLGIDELVEYAEGFANDKEYNRFAPLLKRQKETGAYDWLFNINPTKYDNLIEFDGRCTWSARDKIIYGISFRDLDYPRRLQFQFNNFARALGYQERGVRFFDSENIEYLKNLTPDDKVIFGIMLNMPEMIRVYNRGTLNEFLEKLHGQINELLLESLKNPENVSALLKIKWPKIRKKNIKKTESRRRFRGGEDCKNCCYLDKSNFCLSPVGQCLKQERKPKYYGTFGSEEKCGKLA